eukprot:482215-Prymnesium_polylepis.1
MLPRAPYILGNFPILGGGEYKYNSMCGAGKLCGRQISHETCVTFSPAANFGSGSGHGPPETVQTE